MPSQTATHPQYRMLKYEIQKIDLVSLRSLFPQFRPRGDTIGNSFLEFLTSVLAYAIINHVVLVCLE